MISQPIAKTARPSDFSAAVLATRTPIESNSLGPQNGETDEPPKKRTATRLAVLTLVSTVTVVGMVVGTKWGYYHVGHVVVNDATVRGYVHKIGARIDGKIKSVEVVPGQRVQAGQVLFRLEDGQYQAALQQSRATLASATDKLNVEKLAIEQQRQQLTLQLTIDEHLSQAAAGTLDAAVSAQTRWEKEADRTSALVKSGSVSQSEVDAAVQQRDDARAKVMSAQNDLEAAKDNLTMARMQLDGLRVREAGLAVLEADVETAKAQVSVAEANLDATIIRSPGDGWVVDSLLRAGASAKVGDEMMSLWLGPAWVEAWVDEKHLAHVRVGNPVDVRLLAYPHHPLQGVVESIGAVADKELQDDTTPVPATLHAFFVNNSLVPVRIAIPTDPLRLEPGLTAVVGISRAELNRVVQSRHTPAPLTASAIPPVGEPTP